MNVPDLFSADDGRLRVPWRIALFLLVAIAAYAVAITVAAPFVAHRPDADVRLLASSLALLAVFVAHGVALRWLEPHHTWAFVGLGHAQARPRPLALGLLLGALAIALPSLALILTGALRIEPASPGSWWLATWHATIFLLPAALVEEFFLRGYLFAVLREAVGWKPTLIGTSIIFGLLHLNNPSASAESTVLVMIAGFFLGGILLATRSLYAAWMAHFAWNWTMAATFHTAVSGLGLATPNYRTISTGPTWLTGGSWGPEGGLAAGLSMFTVILFLYGKQLRHMHTPLSPDQTPHV